MLRRGVSTYEMFEMWCFYVAKCLLMEGVHLQDGSVLYLPLQRPGLGGSTGVWMSPAVKTNKSFHLINISKLTQDNLCNLTSKQKCI